MPLMTYTDTLQALLCTHETISSLKMAHVWQNKTIDITVGDFK